MTLPKDTTPPPSFVPHPVERRIVRVMAEDQDLTEEQRRRVVAWLEANGIDHKRVARKAITVECNVHGDREANHIICFREFYETPDGHRVINEKTRTEALTFERWVRQTVPLDPDPSWEGWAAYRARVEELKRQEESRDGRD